MHIIVDALPRMTAFSDKVTICAFKQDLYIENCDVDSLFSSQLIALFGSQLIALFSLQLIALFSLQLIALFS